MQNTTEDVDIQITEYNIDPLCEFNNKTYKADNLWVNKQAKKTFKKWFETNCYFNKSCTFDNKEIAKGYIMEESIMGKEATIFDMVSESCKNRME